MNMSLIENGSLIELPAHSNVKAKDLKDALAKIHPDCQFVVMSQNDVETHNPKEIPSEHPKTVEAYTTMLELMGFSYKMGEHYPNADVARVCSLQHIWVNDNTLIVLSVDDQTQIIYNIARSDRTDLVKVEEPVGVADMPYEHAVKRPVIINSGGGLYRDPLCDHDFIMVGGKEPLFDEWNRTARGQRASLQLQMAVIDGNIIIAPKTVAFQKSVYVEEFTLHDPKRCNNSVRAQFDNLAMKMLGE